MEQPTALFKPLPWQLPALLDKSRTVLLSGPSGAGRSRACAEKVHAFLKKYPGATGLMVRKKRQAMTNSTVLFYERTVVGKDRSVKHVPSKFRFEYDNGSVLVYGGMFDEEQKEALRSIGQGGSLDIAWMEEANSFLEDDYNELLARMRGRAAGWIQVLLSTNPDHPRHWIRQRLILGGEAKTYVAGPLDNPYLPKDYIDTLKQMTGVTGLRLRDGKWVQAEGVVYPEWDDNIHMVDPFPIPPDWQRYVGIDFGFVNPFVVLWGALSPDDELYIYRQIYMTNRTVRAHSETINDFTPTDPISFAICDHDAEDRATLEENGIYTLPANKEVEGGLNAVRDRLKIRGNGRAGLYVVRGGLVEVDPHLQEKTRPINLEDEFPAYVWADTGSGNKALKEVPLKLNDHALDALRYLCMFLTGGGNFGAGYA